MTKKELIERLQNGANLRYYQIFEREDGYHEGFTLDNQDMGDIDNVGMIKDMLRTELISYETICDVRIQRIRLRGFHEKPAGKRRGRPPKPVG